MRPVKKPPPIRGDTDIPRFIAFGLLTGILALVPYVGWLLGLSCFLLWEKYRMSSLVNLELPLLLALWLMVRSAAVGSGIF